MYASTEISFDSQINYIKKHLSTTHKDTHMCVRACARTRTHIVHTHCAYTSGNKHPLCFLKKEKKNKHQSSFIKHVRDEVLTTVSIKSSRIQAHVVQYTNNSEEDNSASTFREEDEDSRFLLTGYSPSYLR